MTIMEKKSWLTDALVAVLASPLGRVIVGRLAVALLGALIGALVTAGVLDPQLLEELRLAISGL